MSYLMMQKLVEELAESRYRFVVSKGSQHDLFWDQYDNAQGVDELGHGARLDTYGHDGSDLIERVAASGERA